jgi:hypothetical protein
VRIERHEERCRDVQLDHAYQQRAEDELREAEAFEWAEATVGDVATEPQLPLRGNV